MKIGILGGSFNPVHNGHLHIAREAMRLERLDKVLFVVAARPPHKQETNLADFSHRLKMAELTVEGERGFEVSDMESKRAGASYTADTLRELKKTNPGAELVFIIGADTLPEMKTWRDPAEILNIAALAVFARPGYRLDAAAEAMPFATAEMLEKIAAHTHVSNPMDVSASEVRRRVWSGLPITELVPAVVEKYIHENRLYLGNNK